MIACEQALCHALDKITRVYRQGGIGHIALPDSETGELVVMSVDQRAAEEIIASLVDAMIADLRQRKARGEMLSASEEKALSLWREGVPYAYDWGAVPGGPSFVIPLNAAGRPIGPLHDVEIVLAAHPSEYDIGWAVLKAKRAPGFHGFIRLDGSHRWGRRNLIGRLRFPPGADLLTAWTRLDHLNVDRAMQRLSAEDQRRYLLPYYARRLADGRATIFNRNYQPLGTRRGPAGSADDRWFYFDRHPEDEKRRRAEEALQRFRAGEPLPPDWRAPRSP